MKIKKHILKIVQVFLCLLLVLNLIVLKPIEVNAQLALTQGNDDVEYLRSLESLRDLDYETWQVVVYSHGRPEGSTVLRIVGYPGTLRIDHPLSLQVQAGLKEWKLKDITLENPKLVNDTREAAAEFELQPLLMDLNNNRPLRLILPNAFNEMPIPPYLVKEWRSFLTFENNQ